MGAASSAEEARSRRLCCCGTPGEETTRLLIDSDRNGTTQEFDIASVIQFTCPIFFCKENERVVQVDVVRFGDASQVATVDYYTVDSSAKAGKKYTSSSGTLRFAPEETLQVITVAIIDDNAWDATLEFGVNLVRAHNAQLGLYLHTCRIKIIDDDSFPTNKYAANFESEEKEKEIPAFGIFLEYCKMVMLNPPVFWGILKTLFLDQVKNLYFLLTLYLQMYLVDVVLVPGEGEEPSSGESKESGGVEEHADGRRLLLNFIYMAARRLEEAAEPEEEGEAEDSLVPKVLLVPGNRMYTAMVVGLIYITPFFLLHWIDIKKLSIGVAGHARAHLQTNLLRKFLNYQEKHRSRISMGDLQMTMVRDVSEVVDFGLMKLLAVLAILGKLLLACVFILEENKLAAVPLAVYPVVMSAFLMCRSNITVETCEEMAKQQNNVVQIVGEAAQSYRMIADFFLRPFIVDTYEAEVREYNQRETDKAIVAINNMYLPPWLTTILIGVYMMTAPYQVVTFGGTLTLGAFLATINVFKEVGVELAEIYKEIMEITMSIGPLRKLCHFMNLETDLETRMNLNRRRRELGNTRRLEARQRCGTGSGRMSIGSSKDGSAGFGGTGSAKTDKGEEVFAVDIVRIEVKDLTFGFDGVPCLMGINAAFDQGMLYGFVGPAHSGKSTFLKLIGQVLLPEDNAKGYIFVPPHLRVLHLASDTLLMSSTLLKNIVFHEDVEKLGGRQRIIDICKLLCFPDYMLRELEHNPKDLLEFEMESGDAGESFRTWMSKLSYTDFARLNLARAFVMNPECLVLHKPSLRFDDHEKNVVVKLLRDHVDQKGLYLPEEKRKYRRRRTVFFTCATRAGIQHSDLVYEISKETGMRQISKEKAIETLDQQHNL